jgi:hypothetical protein
LAPPSICVISTFLTNQSTAPALIVNVHSNDVAKPLTQPLFLALLSNVLPPTVIPV